MNRTITYQVIKGFTADTAEKLADEIDGYIAGNNDSKTDNYVLTHIQYSGNSCICVFTVTIIE